MKTFVVLCLLVVFCVGSVAFAQTTKSRPKVDMNKKWELLHDATGAVLASCDAQLKCEVSAQLKQMIVCHERMRTALDTAMVHDRYAGYASSDPQWDDVHQVYRECVIGK